MDIGDVDGEDDDRDVELLHAGGDAIDADKLGGSSAPSPPSPTAHLGDWDGGGSVERGDSMTVEADTERDMVFVVYQQHEVLHQETFED